MTRRAASALLVLALPTALARGADASRPHPHSGVLAKYERVPPGKYGLAMSDVPTEELRSGKPVLRMIPIEGGFTRTCSVQDVHAPEAVVWSAINDLPNYPQMVEGVAACDVYRRAKAGGCETVHAKYTVKASAFKMSYFMVHLYEPKKHCMTFHLDYERLSELSDTVGYWFVEEVTTVVP